MFGEAGEPIYLAGSMLAGPKSRERTPTHHGLEAVGSGGMRCHDGGSGGRIRKQHSQPVSVPCAS